MLPFAKLFPPRICIPLPPPPLLSLSHSLFLPNTKATHCAFRSPFWYVCSVSRSAFWKYALKKNCVAHTRLVECASVCLCICMYHVVCRCVTCSRFLYALLFLIGFCFLEPRKLWTTSWTHGTKFNDLSRFCFFNKFAFALAAFVLVNVNVFSSENRFFSIWVKWVRMCYQCRGSRSQYDDTPFLGCF